jgi:hypothetical protein
MGDKDRTNLAELIRLHQRTLELHGDTAARLFPEKIGKLYRDAVARLGVAVGDMELYARVLDGAEKAAPSMRGRTNRRKRVGTIPKIKIVPVVLTEEGNIHAPLPDAAPSNDTETDGNWYRKERHYE